MPYRIYIRDGDSVHSLEVEVNTTIQDIITTLPFKCHISYQGKKCDAKELLADLGVGNEAVIDVIKRNYTFKSEIEFRRAIKRLYSNEQGESEEEPFNFETDISEWDVGNITDMSLLFCYSKFDGDISQWDVSNVTNMDSMFTGSNFNKK